MFVALYDFKKTATNWILWAESDPVLSIFLVLLLLLLLSLFLLLALLLGLPTIMGYMADIFVASREGRV